MDCKETEEMKDKIGRRKGKTHRTPKNRRKSNAPHTKKRQKKKRNLLVRILFDTTNFDKDLVTLEERICVLEETTKKW